MELFLKQASETLKAKFLSLESLDELANLLEIELKVLIYHLYRTSDDERYAVFQIAKKSGGTREISAPVTALKIIQRKLNRILQTIYIPKPPVHGFVIGRNVVSNASAHITKQKKYVLNIDLKDFFPSINFGRVRGLFIAEPYNLPENIATVISQICCFNNCLPQGAPTSPIISNMICARLDNQLLQLAKKHRCTYTRYADDITFSTSLPNFPTTLAITSGIEIQLGEELLQVIVDNGFEVNQTKTRLQRRTRRQEVTGLTINQFPNVRRKSIRQVRAMLHAWQKFGLDAAANDFFDKYNNKIYDRFSSKPESRPDIFKWVIRGKIEYIGMVRGKKDEIYIRFLDLYKNLITREKSIDEQTSLPTPPENFIQTEVEATASEVVYEASTIQTQEEFDRKKIFISYSRQDQDFIDKLAQSLESVDADFWLDRRDIRAGKNWDEVIEGGLQETEIMLLVMSPDSMKSENVADKWNYFKDHGKTIISLLLKSCDVPFRLRRIQRIDFSQSDYDVAFRRLHWELKQQGLALEPYKSSVEQSVSFVSNPSTILPFDII